MPETLLYWLSTDEKTVLDGGRLQPPKKVCLHARWDTDPPSRFTICEWHDSFVAHLRKKWRDRPFDPIGNPLYAHQVQGRDGYSVGDYNWDLPTANPIRGKRVFRFTYEAVSDPNHKPTQWSGRVTACRFGDVYLSLPQLTGPHGIGLKWDIHGTVRTAVDPPLRLVLMTPWGEGEEDLLAYMQDYIQNLGRETDDEDFKSCTPGTLMETFGRLLPTARPQGFGALPVE